MIARLISPGKVIASNQLRRAAGPSCANAESVTNRYVTRFSAHSVRKASIESSRSSRNSVTSETEESSISAGIRKTENQISAKLKPPRRPALRRSQQRR